METTKIALFEGIKIRRTLHNNEWWFVIEDVVVALTDSVQPAGYIKDMRRRDLALSKGWGQIATPLSVQTAGGAQKSVGRYRRADDPPFRPAVPIHGPGFDQAAGYARRLNRARFDFMVLLSGKIFLPDKVAREYWGNTIR